MKVEINKLQPHLYNSRVYGFDDNKELVEKIRLSGYIKPILITPNFTILSGHRRVDCCKKLGITEIECEIVDVDYTRQLEIMVSENQYRIKSNFQLLKESEIYREIEKRKSYERQVEIGKQNLGQSPVRSIWTQLGETGRTTQIVSEKIGMSETSYKRGLKVLKRLKEEDDPRILWLFENTVNQNIDSGSKLTEKPIGFIQEVIEKTEGNKDKILPIIRELEQKEVNQKIPLPPGKYQVLYGELTDKTTESIYQVPISTICEDNCVFCLWTTTKRLEEGFKIINHWGFRYWNSIVWYKDLFEFGDTCEILLISTKGTLKMIVECEDPVDKEKPDMITYIIGNNFHGPKIKLFIGETVSWDTWKEYNPFKKESK